jgi:TetR/AcrR family tetracycline transcriptional repressor
VITRGAPASRERLTKPRIVDAALRIMDEEGLDAVSMRRVARELGVEAMSLYNHVQSKEEILDGICERVMSEFDYPSPSGDWRTAGEVPERGGVCSKPIRT